MMYLLHALTCMSYLYPLTCIPILYYPTTVYSDPLSYSDIIPVYIPLLCITSLMFSLFYFISSKALSS